MNRGPVPAVSRTGSIARPRSASPAHVADMAASPAHVGGMAASSAHAGGMAALETLISVPVVLLLGLSALQWGLVFHGRIAVAHAAQEAVRAGSVDHGSGASIERGLARGLTPWLYGASDAGSHLANVARTGAHLSVGQAAGWIAWRRLSPTRESFADWGQPARDADGLVVPGMIEIPNDNLTVAGNTLHPASGTAGYRDSEPIGSASGQTLIDANLLKIEFTYGVPVTVPLVGRLAAWIMRNVDACAPATASSIGTDATPKEERSPLAARPLGAIDLGASGTGAVGRPWACAHYDAVDESGRARPRWPVVVSATIRMQSPARDPDSAPFRDGAAPTGPSLGPGEVDPAERFAPVPLDRVNPSGAGPGDDGSADRAPGFLRIGADRSAYGLGWCP